MSERPSSVCAAPEQATSQTQSSSTSGATEPTMSASGEEDATAASDCEVICEVPNPFCVDAMCVPCSDGAFCAAQDEPPVCHPESGVCQSCVQDEDCVPDCSPTFPCEGACTGEAECVECMEHADCPETACDLRTNRCLATPSVFWVDGTDCGPSESPAADPGFGTEAAPYCWMSTALDNVGEGETAVIHLLPSAQIIEQAAAVDDVSDRRIAILGHDNPRLGGVPVPLTVGSSSDVFVHGITIVGAEEHGARCRFNSRLWLTEVEFENNPTALVATQCARATLERTRVQGSSGDAVVVESSTLALRSSVLANNGTSGGPSAAIRASGDSTLQIRYSTLALNAGEDGAASVRCTASVTGEIRNSVIVSDALPSFDCPSVAVRRSVLDDTPLDSQDVVVLQEYNSAWFESVGTGDVSIRDPASSPFADVAVWQVGDPLREFAGGRRLGYPGRVEFAGADQP